MSVMRRLFGCFGSQDDLYHQSHSFSFDSAKQRQRVKEAEVVSDYAEKRKISNGRAPLRVPFNVSTNETFKSANLHAALRDLLVHIIREGLKVSDLFRRPGNSADMKLIMKQLADGAAVNWSGYNFYTVANTAKKFLLNIPGGIFGADRERGILETFDSDEATRVRTVGAHLQTMPVGARQFLVLLFGAWYLIVFSDADSNSDADSSSPRQQHAALAIQLEAVSKSVCGSLFHTCDDPNKVERAVNVMRTMIACFTDPLLHGEDMLDYFQRATGIELRWRQPKEAETQESAANPVHRQLSKRTSANDWQAVSLPDFFVHVNSSTVSNGGHTERPLIDDEGLGCVRAPASRCNSVRRRQLARLKHRSAWFREQPQALTISFSNSVGDGFETSGEILNGVEGKGVLPVSSQKQRLAIDSMGAPVSEPLRREKLANNRHSRNCNNNHESASSQKVERHPSKRKAECTRGCGEADEPTRSVTVERFDFEFESSDPELASKSEEQWSADTVL